MPACAAGSIDVMNSCLVPPVHRRKCGWVFTDVLKRSPILLLCAALIGGADVPTEPADGPWLPDPMGVITRNLGETELPEGFRLSDPHTVRTNVKGDMPCYLLHIGEHPLGGIASAMSAGSGLVFEKCEYVECQSEEAAYCEYKNAGRECLHGWVRGWFVATRNDRTIRELEGLGFFSNPVPCGSRVAYWVLNDQPGNDEYHAYVADISSGSVLAKQLVGKARIGTDNAYFLAVPRWRPDCSEVVFHDKRLSPARNFTFPAK